MEVLEKEIETEAVFEAVAYIAKLYEVHDSSLALRHLGSKSNYRRIKTLGKF